MIVAYFKLSNYCNVGCQMCYIPETQRQNKARMETDILQAAIKTTISYARKVQKSEVLIVLHGGEVLALNLDYLTYVMTLLESQFSQSGLRYGFSIQSSLIPLQKKHFQLLKHYFNSIGSSMDFSMRTIKGSNKAYQQLWLRKVNLARSHDMTVHPIAVPTKQECRHIIPVIDFFMHHQFASINLERYNTFGRHIPQDSAPSNMDYATMLITVFDYVVKEKRSIVVRQLYEAMIGVCKGKSAGRWGTTCMQDFLVFNPDGKVNACPDKIDNEPAYSDVKYPIEKLLHSEVRGFWLKQSRLHHPHHNCLRCEFRHFCRSGCPITNNQQIHDTCSGYKPLLKHIQSFASNFPEITKDYIKLCETIY